MEDVSFISFDLRNFCWILLVECWDILLIEAVVTGILVWNNNHQNNFHEWQKSIVDQQFTWMATNLIQNLYFRKQNRSRFLSYKQKIKCKVTMCWKHLPFTSFWSLCCFYWLNSTKGWDPRILSLFLKNRPFSSIIFFHIHF